MSYEERAKAKVRRFSDMYGVSRYGKERPLARAGSPTGRHTVSVPHLMIQSAIAQKTMGEVEKMLKEEFGLAVNGDEVTVPFTDFSAIEASILAMMKGDT